MGKKKLQRFAENITFKNLFQPTFKDIEEGFIHKGKWQQYFQNDHPLVLELGCGKGEYVIGLSQNFPERNYIGIDIQGARLWQGCKQSNELTSKNVAFIRTRIEMIEKIFDKGEISEIYITFPDPQSKRSKERKRLTAQAFLDRYSQILKPEHLIHLKTDNIELYNYTLQVIREHGHQLVYKTDDVYQSDCPADIKDIRTYYEEKFLEQRKQIYYIAFKLKAI